MDFRNCSKYDESSSSLAVEPVDAPEGASEEVGGRGGRSRSLLVVNRQPLR